MDYNDYNVFDELIANMKKIFLKAPAPVELLKKRSF